jgi:hypothetical protein
MRRRLKVLALCAAALLAVRMMAQDTSGGNGAGGTGDASGTTTPDNSGGSTNPDNSGASGNTNEGTTNGTTSPNGGTGTQGEGTTTTPGAGETPAPGTGTEGTGGAPGTLTPSAPSAFPPGFAPPVPGVTPAASASPSPTPIGPNTVNPGAQGAASPPVTFSVPGGFQGVSAPQSFTLGQGRLAKPPVTFSLSVSQGYDDNLFSADSHIVATPSPTVRPTPTPPLEARVIGFRIQPPYPPTPVYQFFRPKPSPTPNNARVPPIGVIGSPITTLSVGTSVQIGKPRTVFTMDLTVGDQEYWNQPGGKNEYTGGFDMTLVHKLTPRAFVTVVASAVYQKTPNFSLINAPTNSGNGGSYLDGNIGISLNYNWTGRFSTSTTYDLGFNLLQSSTGNNFYQNTVGIQFRYTVSPRNTVTASLREGYALYPSNPTQNNTDGYVLLGLDTYFSSRLSNSFSAGVEVPNNEANALEPYFESDTTLALMRGASLTWTNSYGSTQAPSAGQASESYRTGLSYGQPLSTKLVASLGISFNNIRTTDTQDPAANNTQNQFQISGSLAYTLSPRFSLSLSYTYLDLLNTAVNSSYTRDQIYLGGSYSFR